MQKIGLKNDSSKSVQKLTEKQQQKHKISLFGQKFKNISQEKEITWNIFFFLKTFKSETDGTMHALLLCEWPIKPQWKQVIS